MKRLIGLNIAVALAAAFGGIRVTEEQEKLGLDITEHGIEAYPDYAMSGSGVGNR